MTKNQVEDTGKTINPVQLLETLQKESRAHVAMKHEPLNDACWHAYEEERNRLEGTPDTDLAGYIGKLAAAFYSPGTRSDDNGVPFNDLLFQQKGMLGNLCSNAAWMLDNVEKYVVELIGKLDQAEKLALNGNEVDLRNLNILLDQIERAQTIQMPQVREWMRVSKACYHTIVGEEWKPYVKQGNDSATLDRKATMARLAALRGAA